MKSKDQARFEYLYQSYLNELTLQGKVIRRSITIVDVFARSLNTLTFVQIN